MNNYESYKAVDFIADDYFLNWVLSPNPENKIYWKQWLTEHPDKQVEVQKAIAIVKSLKFREEPSLNSFQKARLLEKINSRIDQIESNKKSNVYAIHPMKNRLRFMGGIAASLVIVAILSYFFINISDTTTVDTDFAEKKEIVLPDGSLVIINSNSEISYASNWENKSEREVWLEGEAFFEVEKATGKDSQPKTFIVHSGNVEVQVLGTTFNVGDRRGETKVTLLTGKVKLENKLNKDAEPLFLEPGEHAEISTEDKVLKKSKVDAQKYASWVNNKLIFENAELLEIKHVLQDNFGLEVIFEDQNLLKRKFTGIIKTDNIEEFLRTLELSFDVNVTKENGKIIFQQ
ncbi:anti-sigma factor [Salinimicrobium marinum]|uniref:Anti-sigma factor n=1 Tax=Salinimicrobium marinum TaxID=680283 RepID=A0A918SKC9_9FLAO|nr:FecR domain-containing protein [Salinimicrobium marinum]GHA47662.1 anti-sigma factor [Salinimicrobium marinum]